MITAYTNKREEEWTRRLRQSGGVSWAGRGYELPYAEVPSYIVQMERLGDYMQTA